MYFKIVCIFKRINFHTSEFILYMGVFLVKFKKFYRYEVLLLSAKIALNFKCKSQMSETFFREK